MKKTAAIAFLSLITTIGFAQNNIILKNNQGKTIVPKEKTLLVESNRIDLGESIDLKNSDIQVKVKNVGSKPINIGKVSTTAFLKVKSKPETAILPGHEGLITLVHEPQDDGQFLETLVIESDASNKMEVLKVFGTIATKEASIK